MKTQGPPRSSKGKGKVEESAPDGETPAARFRRAASVALGASLDDVRKAEDQERQKRKKKR